MKAEFTGWVVVNTNHHATGKTYVCMETMSYTKRDAIKKFVEGSPHSWRYWYTKYNFRCVKATETIETL